jgi:hypothetical protein
VTVSEPVRVSTAVGLKLTATVQVAPGASDAGQLFVGMKSPDAATVIIAAPVPVLVMETVCDGLTVPTT